MPTYLDGIVAGYDGSGDSEQALRWATREADARGTILTACLVCSRDGLVPQAEVAARRHARDLLSQSLLPAEARLGPKRVRRAVARGQAAQVLCDYSRTADMVVIGARGQDGLSDLRLGSVPGQVAGHAHSPVVVVRGTWWPVNHSPGPIVVGVDGSAGSRAAISFAFEEARLRRATLVAVCGLSDTTACFGGHARLEEEFHDAMTTLEKEHPEVTVLRQVTPGSPRHALLAAASGAQLVVTGARGRGGVPGMSLGSVAHALLHYAPCPVAIAREREMIGGSS